MATLILKKPTPGDFFIADVGVIIPGSGQDTFTDAGLIRRLTTSDDTRFAVTGGTLVVNNGVSDLSATAGIEYLETLWVQAGYTVTGAVGTQGPQGLQGTQGNQGSSQTGSQGFQGLQGFQGFQGLSAPGVQGAQGFQGDDGSQGNQGFQGLEGVQGFQGIQGLQGTNPGVQGPQGPEGLQGLAGSQGSQGLQGLEGFQGNQGFQGLQGTNPGVQGPQGLDGSQGIVGPQGNQGPEGVQGNQGNQGIVGAGVQGPQGNQGLQGTNPGPQGNQGSQGSVGTQGFQGFQGANRAKYTFGNTALVPSGGTLQMNGPGNAIQGYRMMRAGTITGASLQVNTADGANTYDLDIRVNGVSAATILLGLSALGVSSVALSAAVAVDDVVTAFLVRASGSGGSAFNEMTSVVEVTET